MNEIQTINNDNKAVMAGHMEWSRDQIDLIKKTVAKGTSDDELRLFLYTCKKTGLDPLIRQIYAVKRGGTSNQMSIQTGIDGYRLIAERTGNYAPGREPSYVENNGKVISSTAYVKKRVCGEWHEVAATAYFLEYAQMFNGKLGNMWEKMPHVMIAKCAEALALRRAFPAEMAGVYTTEEMAQAEVVEVKTINAPAPQRKSQSEPTAEELEALMAKKKAEYHKDDKAPESATEASQKPDNGVLTAKGIVTYATPKNKGGYRSYAVEGYQKDDGKDMMFSTKDETIIETLDNKLDKGDVAGIEYTTKVNGNFTNYNIVGLVSAE